MLTFALDASNCLEIVLPSWEIGQPFRKAKLNIDATWLRSDMYWEKKMYEGSVANLGSAFNNRLLKYFVIEIFLVLSKLSPYCPVGNKVRNAFCSYVLSLKNGTGLLPSEGVIEYICSKDCCIVSGNIEISVGCKNESKFSPQCIWGTIFASWPICEQVFFFIFRIVPDIVYVDHCEVEPRAGMPHTLSLTVHVECLQMDQVHLGRGWRCMLTSH